MKFVRHAGMVLGLAFVWLVYQRSFLLGELFLHLTQDYQVMAMSVFSCAFGLTGLFLLLSRKLHIRVSHFPAIQGAVLIALMSVELAYMVYLLLDSPMPASIVFLFWFSFGASSMGISFLWFRFLVSTMFIKSPEYSFVILFGALFTARVLSMISEVVQVDMDWILFCPSASLFLYLALVGRSHYEEPIYEGKLTYSRSRMPIISLTLMLGTMAIIELISDTFQAFSTKPNVGLLANIVTLAFYASALALSIVQDLNERRRSALRPLWFALFGCLVGIFAGVLLNNLTIDYHETEQIQTAAWALAWAIDIMLIMLLVYETMARFSLVFILFYSLPQLIDFNVKALRLASNGALFTPAMGFESVEAIRGGATAVFVLTLCVVVCVLGTSRAFSAFAHPANSNSKGLDNDVDRKLEELCSQYSLTVREDEVLRQLAMGKSAKTVAETLYLSPDTIRSHTKRIYAKLDVHSRDELMKLLSEQGVVTQLT